MWNLSIIYLYEIFLNKYTHDDLSGGLSNVLHRFRCLSTQSPGGGTVWYYGTFRSCGLTEKVCHWRWTLRLYNLAQLLFSHFLTARLVLISCSHTFCTTMDCVPLEVTSQNNVSFLFVWFFFPIDLTV